MLLSFFTALGTCRSTAVVDADCVHRYIRSFVQHLEIYKDKIGQLGIDELNKVAHSHAIILAEAENLEIKRWRTEIHGDGIFRIVFTAGNIGVNVDNASDDILGTLSKAAGHRS